MIQVQCGAKTRTLLRPAAVLAALIILCAAFAHAQQKPAINITGYNIDATLNPVKHTLSAVTAVTFTALQPVPTAEFTLHSALTVSSVTGAKGAVLNGQRGPNSTILVTPAAPLTVGQSYTWTFKYSGTLTGEGGPVPGMKLAYVGDPITYLLYAGAWFPMTGYQTDRFTADIDVHVPTGYTVIGSGPTGANSGASSYEFKWDKPGFPGTIIAGKFEETSPAPNIHLFTTATYKKEAAAYANSAVDIFAYFTSTFGIPESMNINIVQLPDNTVPAYWAPQIAAIAGNHIPGASAFRLLSNTIAHQWWGSEISPATLNDEWITNGMSRYAELMYLENLDGMSAFKAALPDVAAGALAYDTIPLTSAAHLNAFAPQFQTMTLEKGAMVFHMLRWEVGRASFLGTLRAALSQYKDKSITTADFEKIAQANTHQNLTPFFSQWLDGTGAPDFQNKWAVYRLGNNKGFRTIGEIKQNLELFNMPVEIRIETDGQTVNRIVDVAGTNSQYVIDTFGLPRKIIVDPDDWILKNSLSMQVRVDILKGQLLVAQGDLDGAIASYQKALKINPSSSLAHYRIGSVFMDQCNMQAAVDAFREALRGDDIPSWTEVWSHIEIGKIFDMTGQRSRAIEAYREALQTNDNTSGALNAARFYIQKPYKKACGQ